MHHKLYFSSLFDTFFSSSINSFFRKYKKKRGISIIEDCVSISFFLHYNYGAWGISIKCVQLQNASKLEYKSAPPFLIYLLTDGSNRGREGGRSFKNSLCSTWKGHLIIFFYFCLKEKSLPMRSHSPLKSSKIIRPALRSFKKKKKRQICIMHVDMHKHDGGA